MKRVFIFSICIFLITTSIIVNIPMGIYAADNDFTLSIDYNTINNKNCSLSYDEANNAVNNHGDIYSSDHELVFRYSPNGNYNWISSGGSIYFSDNQLFNFLRSDCNFKTYSVIAGGVVSNNGVIRSLLKGCGFLVGKDSSLITGAIDSLTGNYNYLNDMTYSETDGLTIGKDTVDSLKKKLEKQYYESIGAFYFQTVNKSPGNALSGLHNFYEAEEDYLFDYNTISTYDYSFCSAYPSSDNYGGALSFNKSDFDYVYYARNASANNNYMCNFVDSNLNIVNCFKLYGNDIFVNYLSDIGIFLSGTSYDLRSYFKRINNDGSFNYWQASYYNSYLYSSKYKDFIVFKSYEALYNYVHGSQTAYVSSKINEAGQDIKLSIDDMNTDITDKLDEVIDSINNSKEGMTADELQNAIDKGLEDLKKDTGDIKDNTTDIKEDTGNILEVLKQQNDILLQILGVTEYIAYNKGEDNNNYTIADVSNCFNTMFSSLQYAVLYGVNKTGQNEASTASYAAYSVDTYDTYSTEVLDYRNGLFGKFPFSVPYQLYEWLQVLQTDPVAPMFNYNYGFLIGHTNEQAYDITFDLKQFESWASVGKSFLRLFFTLLFAIGIYKRFKGEV